MTMAISKLAIRLGLQGLIPLPQIEGKRTGIVYGVDTNVQVATKNRLTMSVQITFKNRLNEKANFSQTFTRFSDFDASQILQNVEPALIEDIGNQLADDIFNKAFVNW